MSTTLTPNMNLIIPTVGDEAGPQYAVDVNSSFFIVDQHTHAPGSGVPITPSAMNINAALPMNNNFLTSIAGLTLLAQNTTPVVNTVYQLNNDLYFVDGLGNNIRITQSGAVAGTPGSIANLTSPASASYVAVNSTFVWQSGASLAANLDAASLLMRNISPNSTFALTLQPPAALSSNYSITLPVLPTATSVLTIDPVGIISTQPAPFLVPTGVILDYMGASAPTGYLLCDGAAVSRTTYADLFAIIGISNGQGDGTSTFNLPDARGMFIRGADNGRGLDPGARFAAATGGNASGVGSQEGQDYLSHTHTDAGHTHNMVFHNSGLSGGSPAGFGITVDIVTPTATASASANIQASGGNETRPVNIAATKIIKT